MKRAGSSHCEERSDSRLRQKCSVPRFVVRRKHVVEELGTEGRPFHSKSCGRNHGFPKMGGWKMSLMKHVLLLLLLAEMMVARRRASCHQRLVK
jgi:hypothetical protein